MSRIAITIAALLATTALNAQAPPPVGFSRAPLFDNPTVNVFRLMLQPGARETPHTHPNSMLVVWISRAEVEMLNGQQQTPRTRLAGEVEFFAREVTHAAGNGGSAPFEVVVINIKPDRVPGGTAAPAPPPAGVTRTPVLDNPEVTATRLDFAPSAREPVHTHPYDLVVIPLTASTLEVQIGSEKQTRDYAPGNSFFVARNQPHAVANTGSGTFSVIGVAIK